MISVKQALSEVLNLIKPLDIEIVDLEQAGNRVLASKIYANRDQPPFKSSAMDGYAINSKDLNPGALGFGHQWRLVIGVRMRTFFGAQFRFCLLIGIVRCLFYLVLFGRL